MPVCLSSEDGGHPAHFLHRGPEHSVSLFSKSVHTICSANAAFQFAWFWHYTQSLWFSQDFQRGCYRLPIHRAWGNPLSPGGCGEQGRRHPSDRETLWGNWTEGKNVQQQQQKWAGDRQTADLPCWLPFCVNLSFFPTINPISSACHLVYYLFLHPTFPYNVLSPAAFYSQLAHPDLDSPSPAKALLGNSIPLLLSHPFFGSYVLPPCP